jgi:hypothetical protein
MVRGLKVVAAVAACVALTASGCGKGKGVKVGEKHDVGDKASFFLEAADQTSNGKTVKVPEVYLKGSKGYVAIHANANGAPGPVIGVSDLIPEGETEDIKIKLKQPLKDTADVWPMVHLEDNGNSTYDFPNGDGPAKVNNSVVVVKVHVKVR